MRLNTRLISLVLGGTLLTGINIPKAQAFCIPSLYNCFCSYIFPCPVHDSLAQSNTIKTLGQAQQIVSMAQNLLAVQQQLVAVLRHGGLGALDGSAAFSVSSALPFEGMAPTDNLTQTGSNDPISMSPFDAAQVAVETTTSPGIADSAADADARAKAVDTMRRTAAVQAYTRSVQARYNSSIYASKVATLEAQVDTAINADQDWEANEHIKTEIHNIQNDMTDILITYLKLHGVIYIKKATNIQMSSNTTRQGMSSTPSSNLPSGGALPAAAVAAPGQYSMAPNRASAPYDQAIVSAANKYGVPADMLRWQINKESSFNPNAQNRISSAHGLAQIVRGTAANPGYGIAPVNSSDPVSSINFAAQYDAILYKKTGSWPATLHAYGTT